MYEIIKGIGRGANGEVFLAKHKEEEEQCVIKRLRMRDITDQERKTIETELKLLKDFRHPNIVAFRDSFIDKNGSLNIVMPYCEGGDLHNLIQESGGQKFPEKQILDWVVQVGLALYYMHERRVLHRDVKTQNIFLKNGQAMLGDLGVAKVLDQAVDLARTNIGTPYYMSPEQYKQRPYSYKSDIWAFGCIIYEMCNHKHVFEALSINALAVKVMRGVYAPVSEIYSQNLRSLVDEMLAQNPKNRPSILEILKKPFLVKKVHAYLRNLYDSRKEIEGNQLESILSQAKVFGVQLGEPSKVQDTPKTKRSKSQNKIASNEKVKKEKEKKERQEKYQQLKQRLAKEIQERNKAQQQLKDYKKQKKGSQKNLCQPKNIASKRKGQMSSRTSTSPSSKDPSSLSKLKPKLEEIDYLEKKTQSRNKQKKSLEEKKVTSEIKKAQPKNEEVVEKVEKKEERFYEKFESFNKNELKSFKIEEEYDMHYEQYSDGDQEIEVIQQYEEEVEQQQGNKKKQEVTKLKQEVKQKTQIITNIRNEMTKLDFEISSDSQPEQGRKYNPVHARLTQKINDLKQKAIIQLGREGYAGFLKKVIKSVSDNEKMSRKTLEEILGDGNAPLLHFAKNIVNLERVLQKIPQYI